MVKFCFDLNISFLRTLMAVFIQDFVLASSYYSNNFLWLLNWHQVWGFQFSPATPSRFDELFSQVLQILPAQVENVQEMFADLSTMDQMRKKSVIFNPDKRHQELWSERDYEINCFTWIQGFIFQLLIYLTLKKMLLSDKVTY